MFPSGGGIFPFFFTIIFVVILGTILFRAFMGVKQWQYNNNQPRLTVNAQIVSKRIEVHRHTSNNNGQIMNSDSTSYYVTFEFESHDRLELQVNGPEYGVLAEGDTGNLTFQGTRYHSFIRSK